MAPSRHPLQRISSPSRTISALIHLVGITSFTLSFRVLTHIASPVTVQYGWYFQYLTILGLALSLFAFSLGFAADVTSNARLFAAKNALVVLAAPLEVLISLLYWGIMAVDKTLLMPSPEFAIPLVPDLGFHLAPAVLLAADLLLLSPPWTIRAYPALGLSMGLAMGYWWWVEVCFGKNGT